MSPGADLSCEVAGLVALRFRQNQFKNIHLNYKQNHFHIKIFKWGKLDNSVMGNRYGVILVIGRLLIGVFQHSDESI